MNSVNLQDITKYSDFLSLIQESNLSVSSVNTHNENYLEIEYAQDNIKQNTVNHFSHLFQLQKSNTNSLSLKKLTKTPQKIEKSIKSLQHPLTNNQCFIKKPKDDQNYLEIRKEEQLIVNLQLNDFHGDLVQNPSVGKQLVWNKDGSKCLYIAQEKIEFKQGFQAKNQDDIQKVLRQNEFIQDFGEKLNNVTKTSIFQYDLSNNNLYKIQLPDDIFPGHLHYLNDDRIVLGGFKIQKEFNYGIHLCNNRDADIYLIEDIKKVQLNNKQDNSNNNNNDTGNSKLRKLSSQYFSFYPIYNEHQNTLLYLGSDKKVFHLNYMSLFQVNLSTFETREIMKINEENLVQQQGNMGILGYPIDLSFQLINQGKQLVYSSMYGGSVGIFVLDLQTQNWKRIDDQLWAKDLHSSKSVILPSESTEQNNLVYITCNAYNQGQKFIVADFSDIENVQYTSYSLLREDNPISQICNSVQFQEEILMQGDVQAFLYSIEKVLDASLIEKYGITPQVSGKGDGKLLVFTHGGPHGNAKVFLNPWLLTLFLLGYKILSVNYTGSGGYGQKFIEGLYGKCGEIDAQEILLFVNEIIGKKLCSSKHVAAYGNSYGGYMSAIFASRYSDTFQCAILSNPVISIPFNIHITDIPEWNSAEALGQEINWNFQQGQLRSMFEQSPMCAPMKIPIMLQLGQNDRRVPYQQSIALRAQTIANGIPCETYLYPKADHSLNDCPQTIYDVELKLVLYLEQYLNKK